MENNFLICFEMQFISILIGSGIRCSEEFYIFEKIIIILEVEKKLQ